MAVWQGGAVFRRYLLRLSSKFTQALSLRYRQKRHTPLTQSHLFVAANQNTLTVT